MRLLFAFVLLVSAVSTAHASAVHPAAADQQLDWFHSVGIAPSRIAVDTYDTLPTGTIPGLSESCVSTSNALESNTDINKKKANITVSGCTKFKAATTDPACSGTSTALTCTCIPTFINDQPYKAAVTAAGGKACTVTLDVSTSASKDGQTKTLTVKSTDPEYQALGSGCSNSDIQAILDYTAQQGINQVISSVSGTGVTINYLNAKVSACGLTATKNASSMIHVSWIVGLLIAIVTLMNQ